MTTRAEKVAKEICTPHLGDLQSWPETAGEEIAEEAYRRGLEDAAATVRRYHLDVVMAFHDVERRLKRMADEEIEW